MKTLAALSEVLGYQNPEVVARFAKEKETSLEDAQEIFHETKRWLWLCGSQRGRPVNMVGEGFVIDEMWHVFLLFTRDYSEFCERFFGEFIHHTPKTTAEQKAWKKALAESSGDTIQKWRAGIKQDYELIYDQLGSETLIKWCHEFPKRYEVLRPVE